MNEEISVGVSDEERRKFYELVGRCILRFQHVEDYLDVMFAAVLGGGRERADAIFASVRGMDRKIQLIKGAATGLSGQPWDELDALMIRVKKATDVRGQIAHASPVQNGGLVRIIARTEGGRIVETVGAEKIEEGRMELHKNDSVFTTDDLRLEYKRIDTLYGDMVRFVEAAR